MPTVPTVPTVPDDTQFWKDIYYGLVESIRNDALRHPTLRLPAVEATLATQLAAIEKRVVLPGRPGR